MHSTSRTLVFPEELDPTYPGGVTVAKSTGFVFVTKGMSIIGFSGETSWVVHTQADAGSGLRDVEYSPELGMLYWIVGTFAPSALKLHLLSNMSSK